jgi:hypothetical protein
MANEGNNSFNMKPFQLKKLPENKAPNNGSSKVRKSISKKHSPKKGGSSPKTVDDFYFDRYGLLISKSLFSFSPSRTFL